MCVCIHVCLYACVYNFMYQDRCVSTKCVSVCACGVAALQVGYGVVHDLDEGGGHVLDHVLVHKGWHDGDSDHLSALVNQG